ncbi:MAG TPA: efflux RND transporter permease subunit [Geminicoccaceae bacterium]|nr:efflux RND transporter permease subunit [Geminicoccus sp.]HMU50358.1 efflux RND transporter permease subunit [Geminicoccaceae bacterium]
MRAFIGACFASSRAVMLSLVLVLVAGIVVYRTIPKEADPDVPIPIVYVSMTHEGISPEDAERLLVRPMETELRPIEGIKEMRALASEGHASVTLEFDAGIDIDQAVADVREKVDIAKAELPADTEEPRVQEINLALFPVLVVTLSGDLPERTLLALARQLEDRIEGLPNVLDVEIAGEREELLEVVIDPLRLESFALRAEQLLAAIDRNNRLVAAGALDTGQGRFAVKVPGVFETADDLLNLPLKAEGDRVVRLRDVALVRRTFKDAEGFARVDGRPTLALEVKKRIGTNIIETIEQVRGLVEAERAAWPAGVEVAYTQDKSDDIRMMLQDLENNVVSAVILVMVLMVATMGLRPSLLVGIAVPGSFLAGILVLGLMGLTINIIVLFSLILTSGIVIDGAIIVVEYADRKMAEGMPRREAYRLAAQRMATPVIAGTCTTLAAFMPLLFWPGVVGEFMKYLPITVLATLLASIAFALVFVPVIGSFVGKVGESDAGVARQLAIAERGDLRQLTGFTGLYVRLLRLCTRWAGTVTALSVALLVASWWAYATFGKGVEFFPDVEPDVAQVQIHARGDLSAVERDALVREVEQRILGLAGIDTVYARSGIRFRGQNVDEDVVGLVLIEFTDWRTRMPASRILAEIRRLTADIAGVHIEVRKAEAGPPVGKPVQLQIGSTEPGRLEAVADEVRGFFEGLAGLRDVTDSRPAPGIEWRFLVDRDQAGRFAADIATVGTHVQLVTNGVMVGDYRPDDSDDEIDIRARYGLPDRSIEQFRRLRVNTGAGSVPVSNFVELMAAPRVGDINRVDGRRVVTVAAEVDEGVLPDDKVREIRAWLAQRPADPAISFAFKGEDEEQRESQAFLGQAFGVALMLIAIVLVLQFDSFYQTFLILTAVVFSTVGALLSLLLAGQPFGIVMSGIGVIALAGTIVNNNIVLIDTYNELRALGMSAREAVLRTGAQRLRPVFLTAITTVLGLIPMVSRLNIDFISREVTHGGPSTDWWVQLSVVISGGLTFATLITLILTPCLLMLHARAHDWRVARRGHRRGASADGAVPQAAE